MKKVILFGASGHLGKAIATELVARGYELTAVVRNPEKTRLLQHLNCHMLIADATKPDTLKGILSGNDVVISALGKSVSPNDMSKPSFVDVDLNGNLNIIREAMASGIKKFIYISAFHAEKYPGLTYFKVHHELSEALIRSGLNFTIVKPPALFSAFIDLIDLARKGRMVNIGSGHKKTNPIHERDVATIVADNINAHNNIIEAGGKNIYTRRELNEIVQRIVRPGKKIITVPLPVINSLLPVMRIFSRNSYDKFAFYLEVMQHDTIAPPIGPSSFEDYIRDHANI